MFHNVNVRFAIAFPAGAGRYAFPRNLSAYCAAWTSLTLTTARLPAKAFLQLFSTSQKPFAHLPCQPPNLLGSPSPVARPHLVSSLKPSIPWNRPKDSWSGGGTATKVLSQDVRSAQNIYSRGRRKTMCSGFGAQRWFASSSSLGKDALPSESTDDRAVSTVEDKNKGVTKPSQEKHLLDRLPDISHRFHRPTKEELLAAATGFWQRLRIRFKWLTIRSSRPFNSDDMSAFFSWIIVGHVVWILVGTTTFFSLLILAVNTVFAQGWFSY